MPPKTPKQWPPVARLSLVSQSSQTITISTAGTIPGKTGQGRNRVDSQLASWLLLWGDGQQDAGSGPPPPTLSHTYATNLTTVVVRLSVADINTLTNQATLTVSLPGSVLAPPTNVTAVLQLSNQVLLTWAYPTGIALQFQIYRAAGTDPLSLLTTVADPLRQYTDTGLSAATTYTYAVAAVDAVQTSARSASASVTTAGAPTAPSALAAVAFSSSQIDLTWTDNSSNEDGFQIERDSGLGFALVATVGAGVTAFSDTGLTPLTTYSYRVRAYNVVSPSAYSNAATAMTQDTVPSAPTSVSATAMSATAITVTWTNTASNATSIKVQRRISPAAFATIATIAPTSTSYPDSGLSGSTTYDYQLIAANAVGDSSPSATASATTLPVETAPAAPSGLAALAVSSSEIDLTWVDNSTNESGFQIERSTTGPTTGFSLIASVGQGVTAYALTGLPQSTQHWFRVRAYNQIGNSAYTSVATATTALAAPNAPTGLSAVATSTTAVTLTWVAPVVDATHGTATSVQVQRRISPAAFGTIATVAGNATTYGDSGLTPSTTYDYRVIAVNAAGSSAASATSSATTQTAATVPAAPSGLTPTVISASEIDLSWTDNSTNESGFQVERSTAGAAGPFTLIATVGQGVTSFAATGLSQSTAYWFRVRAYNAVGNSAYSNTATGTTSLAAPNTPTNISATAVSGTQINLSWTGPVVDATHGTPATIAVQRRISPAAFSTIQTVSGSATSASDTTVSPTTTYDYRLIATNAAGSSAPSATASATTLEIVPNAPTTLNAVGASASSINLTWTDNSSNESGFKIERALGPTGGFVQIATVGIGVVAYSDVGLAQSQLYRYQVRAYNVAGNSAYTNIASATTSLAIPSAPTNLGATATTATNVHLTWTAPVVDSTHGAAANILVQRRVSPAAFATIQTISASLTVYDDATAAPSTTYDYRLIATNASGNSSASGTASVTTPASLPSPPAAPSGLTALAVSQTRVNLAWTDNSANEDGFVIQRAIGAGTFSNLATVAANTVAYVDNSVVASTTYNYRVYAYNGGGNSANSNTANVTTPAPAPPNAPSLLTATTQSTTTIQLAWHDNSTDETGFSLERSVSGGAFVVIQTFPPNTVTYLDQGLLPATSYAYRIRAFSGNGNSAYSNTASATTQANPPPNPPIAACSVSPTSTTAGQLVTMSTAGTAPGSAPLSTWTITWGDGATQTGSGAPPSTATHSYSAVGSYIPNLLVRDTNNLTAQAFAQTVSVTPVAPSNLVAVQTGSNQAQLTWVDNSTNETGLVVERRFVGGTFNQIAQTSANTTTYQDVTIPNIGTYEYRVKAIAGSVSSGYSNIATVAINTFADSGNYRPQFFGWGTNTVAGRGPGGITPKIIRVNTLTDTGTPLTLNGDGTYSGELRAALTALGPRFVLFERSGYVVLSSDIIVSSPYLTVAGQTAPSPGISVRNYTISIRTHDVVFQHFRIRLGDTAVGGEEDCVQMYQNQSYNIVLDHMSMSWAVDEVVGQSSGQGLIDRNITVWRSIISEGLHQSPRTNDAYNVSKGMNIYDHTHFMAVVQCLFAHNWERNPGAKGDTIFVEANNVLYDWSQDSATGIFDAGEGGDTPGLEDPVYASVIGNVFRAGPSTPDPTVAVGVRYMVTGAQLYRSDNVLDGGGKTITPFEVFNGDGINPNVGSAPVSIPGYVPLAGSATRTFVQANAGARPLDRDSVDTRIVNDVINRTGSIINSQNDVGGFPALANNNRSAVLPPNPFGIADAVGRTNLELWLESNATFGAAPLEP